MNPELGKRAAEETRQRIKKPCRGPIWCSSPAGWCGTGTGASAIIAKIARSAPCHAIVTKPFSFEGAQRKDIAERGLSELKKEVDAYIVIPNDKLLSAVEQTLSLKQAFALCDEVLREAVEGVSDIIRTPGDINTDFNDIKAVMEGAGPTLMGIGIAEGDERAKEAAKRAVNSPLMDISISGAKGVLWVVAHSDDLGIMEVHEASKIISESVDKNAKIIWGVMKDNKLKKGQVRIIVIATGFPESAAHASHSAVERSLFSMPAEKREEERGRIYHEILKREEKETKPEKEKSEPVMKEEPLVTATPHKREEATPVPEDDETWGAIPAFLRRNKK
jgi:cell division protein FtsZ